MIIDHEMGHVIGRSGGTSSSLSVGGVAGSAHLSLWVEQTVENDLLVAYHFITDRSVSQTARQSQSDKQLFSHIKPYNIVQTP